MAINREDWVRSVVPSGTVIAFAGATPPTGWLLCNGSTISRAAYPALFTALSSGTLHGTGDGSTTFHLPDYSGRFLRGVANGSANDPDRASRTHPVSGTVVGDTVGSVQNFSTEQHRHFSMAADNTTAPSNNNTIRLTSSESPTPCDSTGVSYSSYNMAGSALEPAIGRTSIAGGSTETRPKNANVNYIIKA